MTRLKAVTRVYVEYIRPPVPSNHYDWRAAFDNYEPGDELGHGATKEGAVADLLDQLDYVPENVEVVSRS